jgi:hypothetical protein
VNHPTTFSSEIHIRTRWWNASLPALPSRTDVRAVGRRAWFVSCHISHRPGPTGGVSRFLRLSGAHIFFDNKIMLDKMFVHLGREGM